MATMTWGTPDKAGSGFAGRPERDGPSVQQEQRRARPLSHRALYLAAASMHVVVAMAIVGLAYYAKATLQASLMQLALIAVTGNIVFVVSCPVLGGLSDRYGRRPFVVTSTLVFAGAFLGAYLSTQVWQLYVVAGVAGLAEALFWPLVAAELAAEADSQQLLHRMGGFNVSWSVGDIVGALAAGLVLEVETRMPFLLCIIGGVSISVLTSLVRMAPATVEGQLRHQETIHGHMLPHNHRTFWKIALLANFTSAGVLSILRRLFPDLSVEVLHYTGRQYGALVMMVAVFRTLTFVVLQSHRGWLYRPRRFFLTQLLYPIAFSLMVFGERYWVFLLAAAMLGTASAVVYFSSLYYSVHGASRQAQQAGIHESMLGLGAGIIPFMAGPSRALAEPYWEHAIRAPYVLGVLLFVVALAIQLVIYQRSLARSRHKGRA